MHKYLGNLFFVGFLLSIIPCQGVGHVEDSELRAQAFRALLQAIVGKEDRVEIGIQKRHALSCYFKGDYNPAGGRLLVAEKTTSTTEIPSPEESTADEDTASEDVEDEEYLEEEGELIVEEAC